MSVCSDKWIKGRTDSWETRPSDGDSADDHGSWDEPWEVADGNDHRRDRLLVARIRRYFTSLKRSLTGTCRSSKAMSFSRCPRLHRQQFARRHHSSRARSTTSEKGGRYEYSTSSNDDPVRGYTASLSLCPRLNRDGRHKLCLRHGLRRMIRTSST